MNLHIVRIAWIAVRELIYERVFYLLLTFAAFALGMSLLLGQLTYAEQSKLTLDFMLAGMELSMVMFCVFMGIYLFKRELTIGSVSMVLSKPISRHTFLLGKYFGQMVVQFGVVLAMAIVIIFAVSRYGEFSIQSILQSSLLIYFEISVLTAITYFFAVNSSAITTSVATLSLFCLGHLRTPLSTNVESLAVESRIWFVVKKILPDFEIFNMKSFASYGYSIPWVEVGYASLYAVCCIVFFLVIASLTFQHKDILT